MESFQALPQWVQMEHQVAHILQTQEEHGWQFDEDAARQLTQTLQQELRDTEKVLRDKHPFVKGSEFTPKRPNKTAGYVAGATLTKLKEFNPTSRDHIP